MIQVFIQRHVKRCCLGLVLFLLFQIVLVCSTHTPMHDSKSNQQQSDTSGQKDCRTIRFELYKPTWISLGNALWFPIFGERFNSFAYGTHQSLRPEDHGNWDACREKCRWEMTNTWFSPFPGHYDFNPDPCVARDHYCAAQPYAVKLILSDAVLWNYLCGCRTGIIIEKAHKSPQPTQLLHRIYWFSKLFGFSSIGPSVNCSPEAILKRIELNGWRANHLEEADGRTAINVTDENVSCEFTPETVWDACFCDTTGHDNCNGRYEPWESHVEYPPYTPESAMR